jgi:hypothetical protein
VRLEKQRQAEKAEKLAKIRKEISWRYVAYGLAGALAIAMCNAVSVMGQLRFASTAFNTYGLFGELIFSIACESVALFLGVTGLLCDLENTPSMRLRFMSLCAGAIIGALNYSHDPGTVIGMVTGGFSFVCPILWDLLGRKLAEPILIKNGIGRSKHRYPSLGLVRFAYHPVNSFRLMWEITAEPSGDATTVRAIREFNRRKADRLSERAASKAARNMDAELQGLETA